MSVHLNDLRRTRPILEAFLLEGIVVIDESRRIRLITWKAKNLLGRRERDPVRLLGEEAFEELCSPFLEGNATKLLWRDVTVPGPDGPVRVSARGFPVEIAANERGVAVLIADISSEIGLADLNARLVEELREANRSLRQQIAAELRAHEDDVGQFAEILQIAPVIFGSFLHEAQAALASLSEARMHPDDLDRRRRALADLHTLKGNARSLGLNLIGGRAHAVEDLFASLPAGRLGPRETKDLTALSEQLSQAVDRAEFLSERLRERQQEGGEAAPQLPAPDEAQMLSADAALERALSLLGPEGEAHAAVAEARQRLHATFQIPLAGLLHHLKTTALKVAQAAGLDPPRVRVSGGQVRVPPPVYRALAVALPHMVRNAIVHGLEPPDERCAAGKPPAGFLELTAVMEGAVLALGVRDDGRGIDVDGLRARAQKLGTPGASELGVLELLTSCGVSTAPIVSREAGRGMGLAAAREAVTHAGGTLTLEAPRADGGTCFYVRLPVSLASRPIVGSPELMG